MADDRARFPWLLTAVTAMLLVLLVSLGVWQVQRMQWKQTLIADAAAAAALPPAPAAAVLASDRAEFRKVVLLCPGLASAPWVELQSIHEGQAGVRLISACRDPGLAGTVLVDRGFVADVISARPPVAASDRPVQIVAEARDTPPPGPMAAAADERRFYARDNAAMGAALGVDGPLLQWTFFALSSPNPEWGALQPSAPPAAFTNNHLGYAITWFGLALALVGFYIALLRRRRAPDRAAPSAEP